MLTVCWVLPKTQSAWALTHPGDLIQGHSGPEFETLGDLECD